MSSLESSNRSWYWSIAIVIGAPFVWLCMLEAGYLLSHWACGTGMKWPLHVVTFSTMVVLGTVLLLRRNDGSANPTSIFLATIAWWFTAGFLLLAIASAIHPLIIPPCG